MADLCLPAKATVLMVEDDPPLLQLVSWHLRGFGYHVVEAHSAAEALRILSDDGTFDLIFTNVVLSDEPNGIELARRARQTFGAGLKVLLTSGYLNEEIIRHYGSPDEGTQFLPKPYTRHELAAALRTMLGPRA